MTTYAQQASQGEAKPVTKLVVRARIWITMPWYVLQQAGTLHVGNRLLVILKIAYLNASYYYYYSHVLSCQRAEDQLVEMCPVLTSLLIGSKPAAHWFKNYPCFLTPLLIG